MPEPEDKAQPQPDSRDAASSSSSRGSRRMRITPEQRRFLGPARTRHDWIGAEEKSEQAEAGSDVARAVPQKSTGEEYAPVSGGEEIPYSDGPPDDVDETRAVERAEEVTYRESAAAAPRGERPRTRRVERQFKLSRILETQNVALLFGAVFILAVAFWVGRKFDYWRYLVATKNQAEISAAEANRFPNASAGELVDRGMVEERLGNWKEAADRYIAAKYKNLFYPGLLFRAGKIYYDHGGFDVADSLFERAIAFKEDIDTSNYYRGMIASGRSDYSAAQRFYEAASNAAPFNADYFYSWAEVLRRDHKPKEALMRYDQAALRARDAEENICRFKMRLTMIEAGDTGQLAADLETKRSLGPLSVDWLMTEAALRLQAGQAEEAVRLIQEARITDRSLLRGHFAACAGDKFFSEASGRYPEIAEACRMQTAALPQPLIGR